jgi:hypothetical protein
MGSVIGSYLQARMAKKRKITDTIYRPLFNQVYDIAENGHLPYNRGTEGGFESVWRKFDAYQRFYVKESIAGQMTMLEGMIMDFPPFLDLVQHELKERAGETPFIIEESGGQMIVAERSEDGSPKARIDPEDWVKMFAIPLIRTEEFDDLRENLLEYSRDQGGGHHRYFESWSEDNFRIIWDAMRSAEEKWDWVPETSYEHYLSIRNRARMVQDELGEKILGVL